MPEFLKDHPLFAPVLAVLGGLLAVFGRLNDAYDLYTAGLPNPVWETIGLVVFFVSIGAIVYRNHCIVREFANTQKPAEQKPSQPEIDGNTFPDGIDTQWISAANFSENTFYMTLRVFNGTGFKVRVDLKTEGFMLLEEKHKVQTVRLEKATANKEWLLQWDYGLFTLFLNLRPERTKQFRQLLDNGERANFYYNTFKIHITAGEANQIKRELPFADDGFAIDKGMRVGLIQMVIGGG